MVDCHGQAGARLAPILSLLAFGLPVLALGSSLGGIDLEAALGAELVTAGTAILLLHARHFWPRSGPASRNRPCSCRTRLSASGGILPFPELRGSTRDLPATIPELVLYLSNPFCATFAPRSCRSAWALSASRPSSSSSRSSFRSFSFAWRAGGCGRRSFPRPAGRGDREQARRPARLVDYIPGPSLDSQPRALARMASQAAVALDRPVLDRLRHHLHTREPLHSGLFYHVWGHDLLSSGIHVVAARVNAWEVSIGLLLLSVSAATSLAEERDRGGLDVIMATPLETREIVWGKWWGTFAMVPRLAILPIWVTCAPGQRWSPMVFSDWS